MIGFPFDSLVTYDEYGNPIFDRAVSSKPLKSLISKLFTTGVMPNPSDNFQVFAGAEGMTVVVHAGYAVIDGGLKLEENNRTLEIQASNSNYDRIDTVILRWNGNDNARVCDLYVLEGTPAPNPVRPELTRAGSIYEIGLADIIIPRNSGAISQQRITDTRYDSDRCGIVSSVSEFDTTTLYAQVQADLADFKAEEQADFIAWFNTIKDKLDEADVAVLQGEIDDINEPTITEASIRANIATGDTYSTILGKIKKFFSDLKSVAFSGSYNDLSNKPNLATVATSGSYNDLSNRPSLASVATSGSYDDLSDKPSIPDISGKLDKKTSGGLGSLRANGIESYCLIAEFDTNFGYIDYTITLEVSGRGIDFTVVQIRFATQSTADPALDVFTVNTNTAGLFGLFKTGTGKWQLYFNMWTWNSCTLHRISGDGSDYCNVKMTKVTSLPDTWENAIKPTYGGYVECASSLLYKGQVTINYGTTGSVVTVQGPRSGYGFASRVSGANCTLRMYPMGQGTWYIHADGLTSGQSVVANWMII